jgi:hypothetical protein
MPHRCTWSRVDKTFVSSAMKPKWLARTTFKTRYIVMKVREHRPSIPGPTVVRASETAPDGTITVLDCRGFRLRFLILRKQG